MGEDKLPIGRVAFAKSACIEWISEHSKSVLISLASGLVLLFVTFQLGGKFSGKYRSDFVEAQSAYSDWIAATAHDDEVFKKLEKPLRRNPELQAQFGALIAQHFLTTNNPNKAEKFAKQSWQRTRELLSPYYAEFSQTSLLIAQHQFPQALESARQLKTKMADDAEFWKSRDQMVRSGGVLYVYNLLRIAALEQEVGSADGELAAWNELLSSEKKPSQFVDPEVYSILSKTFQDGKLSLHDYIVQRKAVLEQSR